MKKILIISLFIFVLISNCLNLCYATEANVLGGNSSNLFYIDEPSTDSSNTALDLNSENSLDTFQQENVFKITNSISKLPQTGDSINTVDVLYALIIFSISLLITIIYKNIKYKNNNDR